MGLVEDAAGIMPKTRLGFTHSAQTRRVYRF